MKNALADSDKRGGPQHQPSYLELFMVMSLWSWAVIVIHFSHFERPTSTVTEKLSSKILFFFIKSWFSSWLCHHVLLALVTLQWHCCHWVFCECERVTLGGGLSSSSTWLLLGFIEITHLRSLNQDWPALAKWIYVTLEKKVNKEACGALHNVKKMKPIGMNVF